MTWMTPCRTPKARWMKESWPSLPSLPRRRPAARRTRHRVSTQARDLLKGEPRELTLLPTEVIATPTRAEGHVASVASEGGLMVSTSPAGSQRRWGGQPLSTNPGSKQRLRGVRTYSAGQRSRRWRSGESEAQALRRRRRPCFQRRQGRATTG